MKIGIVTAALALFTFSLAFAHTAPNPPPMPKEFTALKSLVGTWDGTTVMEDGKEKPVAVEYKLTFDGDKLKGKGAAEFGGEKREWDIEGKRQKDDK